MKILILVKDEDIITLSNVVVAVVIIIIISFLPHDSAESEAKNKSLKKN